MSSDHKTSSSSSSGRPVRRRAATIINLIYQYASVALTVVRGIVMVPIFLFFIPMDLYGAWMASGDVVAWILLTEAGTSDLIRQQVAQHVGGGKRIEAGQAVGAGLLISAALAAVVLGAGVLISPYVPALVNYQGEQSGALSHAVLLAVIATAMGIVCGGVRAAQQGLQRPLGVGIVGLCAELLSILLSLVLLLWGWGLYAIPIGFLAREVVNNAGCATLFALSARELRIPVGFSRARVVSLTYLAGWTFLSRVGHALGHHLHAFLIARFLGPAWVPATVLSRRVWEILYLLLSRLSFSFQPGLAHLRGSGELPRFRNIVHRMLAVVLASSAVAGGAALALNQPFMKLWLGDSEPGKPDFFAGALYNGLTGVATLLSILLFTACQVILAAGRIRESAVAHLLPNVANGLLLLLGLLLASAWELQAAVTILAVPVAAVLSHGAVGLTYALLQWRAATDFTPSDLRGQALSTARLVAVAAAVALGWRLLLPMPYSWLTFVVHGAACTAVLAAAVLAVEPGVRADVRAGVGAVARRLRGAPAR